MLLLHFIKNKESIIWRNMYVIPFMIILMKSVLGINSINNLCVMIFAQYNSRVYLPIYSILRYIGCEVASFKLFNNRKRGKTKVEAAKN